MNKDSVVIEGLRSGDEKAYKYLYDFHYSILCAVANRYIHDYDVGEMIVSDVIYAIWKNRSGLIINQTLRGYLLRAVKNGCLNYLNRQSKQISIEPLQESLEDGAHPLEKLIEQELDIKIEACIKALPGLTRQVFVLSRFEELKYNEIAQRLNISVDVVKYHVKSALSKLRKELQEFLVIVLALLFL
ncbi:MAG: RNA polymerase sigma-70 factor [Tannerellaceae bacterium]|jgi:RNA polymerase sigma-70 factor (ECF subfamily)|nr:RNA polymerase sigma-70 factor [Tannerellaceae bacterium]